MLADLDRPVIEYYYEKWDKTLRMQVLSASQFVEVMDVISTAGEDDRAAKIAAMSKVCSLGILEPAATADEWAKETTIATLMDLGNFVLTTTSEQVVSEAKKK